MLAMDVDQALAGEQAHPQEERNAGVSRVFADAAGHVHVGILEDVGRINAPLQAAVEAQHDHPPQSAAVAGE